MNEIKEINTENMIYEIRGKQVMLDSDLAKLYKCKNGTKEINQAVNRNINKFPNRFSWQLDTNDINILRSQFVTTNLVHPMSRSNPRVFTEQGVAMLATILKTEVATEVSIQIMDAFVSMKNHISKNLLNSELFEYKLLDHDKRIDLLEHTFSKFKEKNNHIFFEGQIYDAYSLLVDILKQAKEKIIIIDNYIDKTILDIISLIDIKVDIITNKYNNTDIEKYKKQYSNLNIIINNTFHDRFIILDNEILYHFGASFKDLGNKCFSINKIEDKTYLKQMINELYL